MFDDGSAQIVGAGFDGSDFIKLDFSGVVCVRIVNESVRLRLMAEISGIAGRLIRLRESLLLDWIVDESLGITLKGNMYHYMVGLGDEFVEIVCDREYVPAPPDVDELD